MRNLRLWSIALFVAGVMQACGHKATDDRLNPISIVSQPVLGQDSLLFGYISDLQLCDSLLYVLDNRAAEYGLRVYEYPSLRFVNQLVIRGKGPEDMLSVAGFVATQDSVRVISVQDPKMQSYSVADICSGFNKPASVISYATNLSPVIAASMSDSGVVLVGSSPDKRFTVIDDKGVEMGCFRIQALPSVRSKMAPPMLGFLWQPVIACRNRRVVLGTKLGDVLEIYDLQDTMQSQIIVGEGGEPDMSKTGVFGKVAGFQNLKIQDKTLFALYDGSDLEKVSELLAEGKQPVSGAQYLRVYDVNTGELEKVYQLDRYISSFDVLTDGKTVIAADPNAEHQLCTFTLPD